MIRIALVSYFNTRPFMDGLRHGFREDELELKEVPPSECGRLLLEGGCDLALVPVGALVDFGDVRLMKDHCLGADGKVDSVFLFSHVPVRTADTLLLDPHSRSSNGLAMVLLREYWDCDLRVMESVGERFSAIQGRTCGVAIGDKAHAERGRFRYVYDLAEIWKRHTGLPFVFAVWAYRADSIGRESLERIRAALEWGRLNRRQSAEKWAANYGYGPEEAIHYLTQSISYAFDSTKHEAMKKYLHLLQDARLAIKATGG